MLKWLNRTIGATIVAVLSALGLTVFQAPISNYFSRDRLEAKIDIAPWRPRPIEKAALKPALPVSKADQLIVELSDLLSKMGNPPGEITQLRVSLTNDTPNVIKNISLRLAPPYSVVDAIIAVKSKPDVILKREPRIKIPDMAPGDDVVLYIWSGYPFLPEMMTTRIKTYSSAGSMRVAYDWPKYDEDLTTTPSDDLIVKWGTIVVLGGLFFLIGLLVLSLVLAERYVKKVMESEDFFLVESVRYREAPKRFVPDLKSTPDRT